MESEKRKKDVNLVFWAGFVIFGVIFLLVVPNTLSIFQINLLGKFLTFAIVAIGLDLIWGYTGMMSLGQGFFFGLGAYCSGMYLNLETAGDRLPDFMGLYGVSELPWFWQPFQSPVFAILAAIILPMIVAGILGYMLFRSRIQGVYFAIVTQAFTAIISLLLIGQQKLINGTNGITEMKTIFGYDFGEDKTKLGLYIATVLILGLVYLFSRWLVNSRFGRVLVAVRDDEERVRFIGYNPVFVKTVIFIIAAGIAGIAGALFTPQAGIISPKQLDIQPSIEIVIFVAVGGRGTLFGAVLGALAVNIGKSTISSINPDLWQLIIGALFIGVVVLFPKGIVGSAQDAVIYLQKYFNQRKEKNELSVPDNVVSDTVK